MSLKKHGWKAVARKVAEVFESVIAEYKNKRR